MKYIVTLEIKKDFEVDLTKEEVDAIYENEHEIYTNEKIQSLKNAFGVDSYVDSIRDEEGWYIYEY